MKIIRAFFIVLILAILAFAEKSQKEPRERFAIDFGGGMAFYSSLIVLGLSMDDFDYQDGKGKIPDEVDAETNFAVASFGVRYIFTPHIEAGLASSYEYYSSYKNVCSEDFSECKAGNFIEHHLIHLALEGKFNWFTLFDYLRPYSRVGLGAIFEFDRDLEHFSMTSFQLTPIGLEFLFPYVSLYAEMGAGYRGFISGGISIRI